MSKSLDEAKKKLSVAASLLGAARAQRHPIANLKVLEALVAGVARLSVAVDELENGCKCDKDIKIGGTD